MKRPPGILIDLDNTVYPYDPCHNAGLKAAHRVGLRTHPRWKSWPVFNMHYEEGRQRAKAFLGNQAASHNRLLYFQKLIEIQLCQSNSSLALRLYEAYWKGYFSKMKLDLGCLSFLKQVKKMNIKTAWVTDQTTEIQMRKIKYLGLNAWVNYLVTSEEAGREKPHRAPFRLALRKLEIKSNGVWMIGDDFKKDIQPAMRLNMRPFWVQRERKKNPRGRGYSVITRWAQLTHQLIHVEK